MFFIVILLVLAGITAGIIHLPATQHYLAGRLMRVLEKNIQTEFSFSSVRFGFFRPVIFKDFLIRDRQEDTLIYARSITAWPDLKLTSVKDKGFVISKADVEGAFVRLIVPADTAPNYEFLFSTKPQPANRASFYFAMKQARLKDSRFMLKISGVEYKPYGVHFTDLYLHELEGNIKNLEIFNRILTLSARNVSFRDASGWTVRNLSGDMENSPKHLWFNNIRIVTPWSDLRADYYHMDFDTTSDYKDFANKVHLSGAFRPSLFGYRDFCAIAQTPRILHNDIHFSGKAHGVLSNLVITRLKLDLEKSTSMEGSVNLVGLPDFRETYLHLNVKKMVSHMDDIAELYQPGTDQKLKIPENFRKFGNITYTGKFTGFLNDFVSYGTLTTDIGTFNGDISISADSSNHVNFNGFLATKGFDIGVFSGNEQLLGKVTSHANMHGTIFNDKSFSSLLTGNIDSIEINRYTYRAITIDGRFSEKAYDGSIKINDPNLKLDFLGMIDLTKRMPDFDFSLNVLKAALFPLHITRKDTNLVFSGLLLAGFSGNRFEEFNGHIKLLDARMERKEEKLNIYNIQLLANNAPDSGALQLRSDYLKATLEGQYDFSEMISSLKYFLSGYLPGSFQRKGLPPPENNNFVFHVDVKNIKPFTDFFMPGYYLAPDTHFSGRYAPALGLLQLEAMTDQLTTPHISVDTLAIHIDSDHFFSALLEGAYVDLDAGITKENFVTRLQASHDTIDTHLSWNSNVDTLPPREELHLLTHLSVPPDTRHPHLDISIDSTDLVIGPRVWHLHRSNVSVDSTTIDILRFGLTSGDKSLVVHGTLSEEPADTLAATFHNLDIAYLTDHEKQKKLRLAGIMNGNILLSNIYHNPVFLSTTTIQDFSLNDEPLGNAVISSGWDTLNNSLLVDVHADYGTRRPISIIGTYTPAGHKVRADILFDKFRLKAFSSFVSMVFSSLTGNVSGNLHVEGNLLEPAINGDLDFQKISLTVDYLKTKYNFTSKVPVRDNRFLLDSILVYDELGNKGVANGHFALEKILSPSLDMTVNTPGIMVLNTTTRDNEYFYGRGIASGGVSIQGPLNSLTMNISARTGPNTSITLPLASSKGESIETDYIHFVNSHSGKTQKRPREKKKMKKKVSSGSLNFNLDLNVTPDAEVTLLFDPAAGGTLYGLGHGNLRMEVHRNGDFNLYGEYIIDEGTYHFTLQNVINKKFRLENGGRITWNGDPLNAHLDILAVYPRKVSLYPLFFDDNYKKRVPVECQILLKGSLNDPQIGFNIDLPTVDEDTRSKVRNAMSSEEEMSKQFLSLLIINSFYPNPVYSQQPTFGGANVLGVTTTEVLSNQLSSWLSQISKDFDVGFSYHPGDEVSSEQVEVALSTQLLNDRVSINGNIDINPQDNTTTQNSSNIVGDFQVEVKITKNGKLRVKAFTRANDNYLYETAPYTNGIGIFYREEFSSWDKLFKGYWQKLFGKKDEEEQPTKKKKKNN